MTATADLSLLLVGASPPAVLRSQNGARRYKYHIKCIWLITKYTAFYPQNVDFSHFRVIFCDLLKKFTQPPNIRCLCGRAAGVLPSWYYDFNSYLQPFSHFRVIFCDLLKKITQPPNIRCSCGRAAGVLPSWYYDFNSYL